MRFTSDSNEAQFDFFYVLLLKRKRIRIYISYKSKKQCSVSVVFEVILLSAKWLQGNLLRMHCIV